MASNMHPNSKDLKGLTASLGKLGVETSSTRHSRTASRDDADDDSTVQDDIWGDAPDGFVPATEVLDDADDDSTVQEDIWGDSPDGLVHATDLDREWNYRQNQFQKMGYRDGIAEGQKDSAQGGFNAGFVESVHVGYKWGLVRGITSAIARLSNSSREKLLPSTELRGKLKDLYTSVREMSASDALQMFHKSILQSDHSEDISQNAEKNADSNKLQSFLKDLVLLLRECPDIEVNEELTRDL